MTTMEMRVCKCCGQERKLIQFRTINGRSNNLKYRSWTCNVCVYQRSKAKGKHCYYTTHKEQWNKYQNLYKKLKLWQSRYDADPTDIKAIVKLTALLNEKALLKQ